MWCVEGGGSPHRAARPRCVRGAAPLGPGEPPEPVLGGSKLAQAPPEAARAPGGGGGRCPGERGAGVWRGCDGGSAPPHPTPPRLAAGCGGGKAGAAAAPERVWDRL